MSGRHTRIERRLPLFQIKVADFRNHTYRTIVIKNESGVQKVDIPSKASCRTFVERFKDGKAAQRWASRFGTVLSCFKIKPSYYLENIEHLNLEQSIVVEVEESEYVLNKSLELSRPRKEYKGKKFDVEVIDNE